MPPARWWSDYRRRSFFATRGRSGWTAPSYASTSTNRAPVEQKRLVAEGTRRTPGTSSTVPSTTSLSSSGSAHA